ncbi:MAG: DUF342 domain-containing protein [Chitinispirillaceae bacterium]|nr:DUF342 domain-containing protein [Chitinispirillaceae bacterium]
MKNPLSGKSIAVEERNDGVYVGVTRSDRESITVESIIDAVENAGVMNFDADRFRSVFSRARGVPEKIGPSFEYYDETMDNYISCSMTPLKASIKISERYLLKGSKPNAHQLLFYLKRKGIVHGIDTERLVRICVESLFERYIDVAAATPPEDGADARIEIKVALSPEIRPKMRSDGSVDYRSIQTFTSVSKGDLLAIRYPPGLGKPGITVTGEPIAPQPGQDLPLPAGRNTVTSADVMQLHAATTGIVFFDNSLLTVAELLHVDNDVDFSVGNIKYTGDVLIGGNVRPGFTVEAEGSIHIKGEIESATVTSRAGQVIIDRGVVGKGDTVITAKKGITLNFAQDAHLRTEGVVTFEKYLLHCRVVCESCEGNGHQNSIIGGEIRAEKSISVRQCGSEKGVATKLLIYDKNKSIINEKIRELSALHQRLAAELEPVERQLKTKAALMKRTGGEETSDRSRDEVRKWVEAYNALKKKAGYVEEKIKELNSALTLPGARDGFIRVFDRCYPGTSFTLYDNSLPVTSLLVNKRFSLKDQSITVEGT